MGHPGRAYPSYLNFGVISGDRFFSVLCSSVGILIKVLCCFADNLGNEGDGEEEYLLREV